MPPCSSVSVIMDLIAHSPRMSWVSLLCLTEAYSISEFAQIESDYLKAVADAELLVFACIF